MSHQKMFQDIMAGVAQLPPETPLHIGTRTVIDQLFSSGIFQYSSLNIKSRELRLVSLLPGARSDKIQCRIMHVSLEDSPNFEALSYAWGDQSRGIQTILLYNFRFPIHRISGMHYIIYALRRLAEFYGSTQSVSTSLIR